MEEHEDRGGPEDGNGEDSTDDRDPARDGTLAKADLTRRIIAAVIDGVIGAVVSMVPLVGGVVTTAYWMVRDGLDVEFMDRRSLGKKVMKLRPVRLDGQPMDIATSVKRNWPFAIGGVALVLAFIPIIGWLLLVPVALVGMIVGVIEAVLTVTDAQGRRMGDKFGETQVIDVDS